MKDASVMAEVMTMATAMAVTATAYMRKLLGWLRLGWLKIA